MARTGWYKVYREMFEHPLLTGDVASRLHAWADLVGMAAFEPTRKRAGSIVVELDRGQVLVSVRFLATRWQWSKSKVQRFLTCLVNESMLSTASETPGGTVYLVVNYDEYQAAEDGEWDTERDRSGTEAGQERDKEKNIRTEELLPNEQPSRAHARVTPEQIEALQVEMRTDAEAYYRSLPDPARRKAVGAELRGIIAGDDVAAWRDGRTGLPVPWEERPARLRLALAALEAGKAESPHWALIFVHKQQDDTLGFRSAEEIQADRQATERPAPPPGVILPPHLLVGPYAGLEQAERERSIREAEEAARAEQKARDDAAIAAWEAEDQVRAARWKREALEAAEQNPAAPRGWIERDATARYRLRVLESLGLRTPEGAADAA